VSSIFKRDAILQEIFNVICTEGREDELRDECDLYHIGFATGDEALEFGFNLGEYVGKFNFGDEVFEFRVPDCNVRMYFIGSRKTVQERIYEVL
jgi:hypothetical protein